MSDPTPTDGAPTTELKIEGMHCGGCVKRVRKSLEKVQGLLIDDVTIGIARLRMVGAQQAEVIRAVEQAGYRVSYSGEG
jgi:copper chaperone CopZ